MEEDDAQIEPTPAVRRLHLLPRAVCRHRREPARHAAGGAASLVAASVPAKVFAQAKPHRIDVHHHIAPPSWLDAMDVIGRKDFPLANWSVQKTIEDMDKGGVEIAMTSPTTPQVTPLGKTVAVRIAREANEYAKKMMTDHPGRFGVFATLPLPHVDESLKEIAYSFDTLKVDGVGIMTSYQDKWLGHPSFDPVWQDSIAARPPCTPIPRRRTAAPTWCRACPTSSSSSAPTRRAPSPA